MAETRAKGLWRWVSKRFRVRGICSYFLIKWGIKRRPGIRRNAGKVMRLKIPNTTTKARMAVAKEFDLCCDNC